MTWSPSSVRAQLCFLLLLQHLLPLAASRAFLNGGVLGLTIVDMQNWPEVSWTLWVPSTSDPSCLFTSAEPWCSILLWCRSRQVIKPRCWLSPQRTESQKHTVWLRTEDFKTPLYVLFRMTWDSSCLWWMSSQSSASSLEEMVLSLWPRLGWLALHNPTAGCSTRKPKPEKVYVIVIVSSVFSVMGGVSARAAITTHVDNEPEERRRS